MEGANSITVADATLTGASNRVMLCQSNSGDALVGSAAYTQTGGSLTAKGGDAFLVKNTTAMVSIKGVTVTASGDLIHATDKGKVTFTADAEKLSGNIVVSDSTSCAAVTLKDGTAYTGTITGATLTLDAGSTWTVTGDSTTTGAPTGLTISGTSVTKVVGNGHTVYYDKATNAALGGKTYTLAGDGSLVAK